MRHGLSFAGCHNQFWRNRVWLSGKGAFGNGKRTLYPGNQSHVEKITIIQERGEISFRWLLTSADRAVVEKAYDEAQFMYQRFQYDS